MRFKPDPMTDKTILLLSEDKNTREMLIQNVLVPAGYEVLTELFDPDPPANDLFVILLSDYPEKNLVKTIRDFRGRFPAAPLILLFSSRGDQDLARLGMRNGAFEALFFPLRPKELLASLEGVKTFREGLKTWARTYGSQELAGLHTRVTELETLTRIGQTVTSNLQLDDILTSLVRAAVEITNAEEGNLLLLDESSGELYMRASYNFKEDYAQMFRLPVQDSLAGQVIQTGKPVMIDRQTPEKIKTSYLVHSLIYVPLQVKGENIGVLGVDNRNLKVNQFDEQDIPLLGALADFAGIALANARLYRQVELEYEKLETTLSGVGDGVILLDTENILQLMNPRAQLIFGLGSDSYAGRNLSDVIDLPELQSVIEGGLSMDADRIEITLPDDRHYFAQIAPIQGVGKVLTLQDVTHFKELDTIKSDFVHTVSHDLRSPLTAILGYVELINRAGKTNAQQREYIRRVQQSVQNITDLINTLLDLGRIEAGFDKKKEAVPISIILDYAVDGIQHQVESKNQILEVDLEAKLPQIFGNPIRLRQMLNNLLENASKYTPDGGLIEISAKIAGDQLILKVDDSGIGIPPGDQPYIFNKLYRASNIESDTPGSGLGLSIVKSIVDNHGGRLWFESSEGRGTKFTVVLPILKQDDLRAVI